MRFAVKVGNQLSAAFEVNLCVIHFVERNVGVTYFKEDFCMAERLVGPEQLSELGLEVKKGIDALLLVYGFQVESHKVLTREYFEVRSAVSV